MRPENDCGLPAWHGTSLRLRRVASGWTAADLGRRLNVDKTTVLRWEGDVHKPTAANVKQLAQALNCDPMDFSRPPKVV